MPPPSTADKNDLFAQYQILEDLGDFPNYSLFRVKAPNGTIKLWKKIDLQFNAASIETRLLPVIEKVIHPNLNAVSNSFLFPDKGLLFVESEFPVKTLRHRLDEVRNTKTAGIAAGGIPVNELFSYIVQVAEAIDYLNTPHHLYQGKKIAIYHRALSPDSLHLFEEKGKIICKLGDFGLAKPIIDSPDAARHSLGLTNYDYSPPEFDEGLTTSTSDQYSLATTYCELRTGKLPFTGTLLQKLQAQLSGNPDLSLLEPAERPIVSRALSREPTARFPNCREFVRQLQQALGGVVSVPMLAPSPAKGTAGETTATGAFFTNNTQSGWALSSKPVGRSGGALFNISTSKEQKAPAKQEPVPPVPSISKPAAAPVVPPPPKAAPAAPAPVLPPPLPTARPKRETAPAFEMKLDTATEKKPEKKPAPAPADENYDEINQWTPGSVSVGPTKAPPAREEKDVKPSSQQDIKITPPPISVRKESISSKAKETLELIKRRQTGGNEPEEPRSKAPAPGGKMFGGVSRETNTSGHHDGDGGLANRRGSTQSMGIPLPPRMQQPTQAVTPPRQSSPVPLPRRHSAPPTPAQPVQVTQSSLDETAPVVKSNFMSLMTLIMVSILAFCIGMIVLFYLAK